MIHKLSKRLVLNSDVASAPNLCDRFSDEDLVYLGQRVWSGYQRDKQSRSKWEKRMEAAMDLAMQIQKDKNFPWPGCANVIFPLVTIASLQFSSRSYENIIQGTDIVKYRVTAPDPDKRLQDQADRISRHMSWQVLEEDIGWEEQHDRLLINLGIVGCNFIKTYWNSGTKCSVSELVMARDFVLNYKAKSVEACSRKTQVIELSRNDIYERVVAKTYCNVLDSEWFNSVPAAPPDDSQTQQQNRQGVIASQPDEDSPYRTYEQHCLLDLDQDGYSEPYIITIEEQTKTVLKLTARWERDEDVDRTDFSGTRSKVRRINPTEYFTKYGFIPAPDGGIYDVGFGTLLGPLNESVNTGINQLLDTGTMANSNGGFLGRGVKIRGGVYTMAPWEWKRVDSTGDDLRKSMVQFPVREPSDVMFKLLGLLIEYTDRLAGTTESQVGINPGQNTPAETSRNTAEAGQRVYKGIYKRVWRSMKEEFKKKHQLNALFQPSSMRFGSGDSAIRQEDYRSNPDLVVPAADPNIVSDSQRVAQAAMMREGAHMVPGYDLAKVETNWLKALKVDAVDHFYPGPDKVPPLPNPKAALEQLKLQGIQMKLEHDKQMFVMELMAARQKTQAEVVKLYAEVGKLLAETQTEKVKAKIEAFSAMVEAFKVHSEMLTKQIEAAQGDKENGSGSKSGAMGSVETGSSNPSLPQPPAQGANGAAGAMVPQGVSG
jgi:chaperonin GroES